ncbi:MAG: type II toxin-antitoxin system RelE/ParE family toxin [Sphingomonadaceae bacterium]|nr:type II toxin-antitoxin system RelE/ParE family toxin [Sphingomonadaceae bacterium]
MSDPTRPRAFKSAWFAKAARKAKISDSILCKAIAQVMAGQADDLGGGVYKKRLSNNQYRSIILARAGDFWVYEFLFAKQDIANIEDDDLKRYRTLAKGYGSLTTDQVSELLADCGWIEICKGELETEI